MSSPFYFIFNKTIFKILFIFFLCMSNLVWSQNQADYITKTEKTADGFTYRVIYPVKLLLDNSSPVYYLYSFDVEGKMVEGEILNLMKSNSFALVVIQGLKDYNGIGQLRQLYLDISADVHKSYAFHPDRNYLVGNMEGAMIASAVAKWLDKDIKGVLLFDGFHWQGQGHPNLTCPIYIFAKSESKELRQLQQLKPKYNDFNKDFNIVEYDNKLIVPDGKLITKALDLFNEKWIRYNDDLLPKNIILRQELSEIEFKKIEVLVKENKFEETYEITELFIKDFSNTTDKKIIAQIEKAQKLIVNLEKEVSVQALIEYRKIRQDLKINGNKYQGLLDTIAKLKKLIEKYPLTMAAKNAGEEIKIIEEKIYVQKLNIENKSAVEVVTQFLKFIEESGLPKEAKDMIAKEYDKAKASNDFREVIATCLVLMNKDYANGMIAFSSEKMKTAEKYFDKINPENNPYLKAYQLYYLARISVIQDNFERAEEILNDFLKSHLNFTTHQADAFFLLAVCYYNQFKRDKAIGLLTEFEKRFPDAPERMIIGAYQLVNKIEGFEEGSMSDVEERMEYSRRKLKMEDIDKPAEDNQEKVVSILNKLIKEAEQQEQNQKNKNKNKNKNSGGGNGDSPDTPMDQSEAPEGESKIGQLKKISRGNREEEWGKDREKEREKIMNALKEKFPERYRELIEQYYKGLNKNDE